MRRTLAIALLLAACGPKNRTTPEHVDEMALGSARFIGLDWGMTPEQATVVYPTLAPHADPEMGWQARMKHDGRAGTLILHFRVEPPAGLSMALFTEEATFPSMGACGEEHKTRRAAMDAKIGPSQYENLAAYWETETASLQLSCNPRDDGGEVAEMTFSTSPLDPMD
jgi:hypothetical protein